MRLNFFNNSDMKKIFKVGRLLIIPGGLFLIYLSCKRTRQYKKILSEKDEMIKKQEAALKTYEQWIELYQQGKKIEEYLQRNGYHSIALYGMGRIGKNLFDVISGAQMELNYVVDRHLSMVDGHYRSVPCYNPKSVLPKTDLIIVTVSGEADSILSQLSGCGSPAISIQRLIKQAADWEYKEA